MKSEDHRRIAKNRKSVEQASSLGLQYVLKSTKAVSKALFLREMYVSTPEKDACVKSRIALTDNGLHKVRMARIEYKGKGKYLEELLK